MFKIFTISVWDVRVSEVPGSRFSWSTVAAHEVFFRSLVDTSDSVPYQACKSLWSLVVAHELFFRSLVALHDVLFWSLW